MSEDFHTLVDCECTAKVYLDNNQVDIEYCPTHSSAPALLSLVKAVEWIRDVEGNFHCPWCYALKKVGHFKDCKRQKALSFVPISDIQYPIYP